MDGSCAPGVPMMMCSADANSSNSGASWLLMMNEMRLGHQQLSRAEAAGTKFWIDVQQERQQQQQQQASSGCNTTHKIMENSSFAPLK